MSVPESKGTYSQAFHNFQFPMDSHSLAIVPVIDELRVLSRKTKTQAPSMPLISSTVLGRVVLPFSGDYFVRHCAEPIRFTQGIYSSVSNAKMFFRWNDMDRAWSTSTDCAHSTKFSRSFRFDAS